METYKKTLVFCDHFYKKPSLLRKLKVKIRKGKICYNENKKCWEEKYVVKGVIQYGWFIPNFLGLIYYRIFWPYGQKEIETKDFIKTEQFNKFIEKIVK